MKNKIQLIVYPDSLGKNLKELHKALNKYFKDIIFGVHILPFFPSSSDRGFSPITQFEVDKKFGNWKDVTAIAKDYDLMCDLVVNHVSQYSYYFEDYLQKGEGSLYTNSFITKEKFCQRNKKYHQDDNRKQKKFYLFLLFLERIINKLREMDFIFHKGGVNRFVLKKIYRPRPGSPFSIFNFADGTKRSLWCTFSKDQIDLDVNDSEVRELLRRTILLFSKKGVKYIRLDAVAYVAKQRGENSFMIPQTYHFIKWIGDFIQQCGMKVLPEVHANYKIQSKLANSPGVDYTYDFILPMLALHALFSGNNKNLKNWINIRPHNQITTLDTHDGLPIPDVEGLINEKELNYTLGLIRLHGGNDTFRASGTNSENVDIYQINCTYYSALDKNDDAYIAARAIQFFLPGIPQVYYVGLLAGKNDADLLKKTNIGRDINRHFYSLDEIKKEIKRDVVKRLFELMRFRNAHPAFNGVFQLKDSDDHILILYWNKGNDYCEARINVNKHKTTLRYNNPGTSNEIIKII